MKFLKDLRIDRIDFVDKCASIDAASGEGAHILLFMRDVEKKTKTEDGASFPSEAFAFVPDIEKPSTWKLRIWESTAKKVTRRQIGMAVAALGPGFRGNKVCIPSGDLRKVKAKVRAAWKSVHGAEDNLPPILKSFEESLEARRDERKPFLVSEEIMDFTNALQQELMMLRDRFREGNDDDAAKVKKAKDALSSFNSRVKVAISSWMKGEPINKSTEGIMERNFELKDIESQDVRDYIGGIETKLSEAVQKIEDAKKWAARVAAAGGVEGVDGDEDVLKGATPEMRGMIEKLQKQATAAETKAAAAEVIAKRLEDEGDQKEMVELCKGWANISVDKETIPTALKKFKKSDFEGFKAVCKLIDGANKASKITKEFGSSGHGSGDDGDDSAYGEVIKRAREMVAKKEAKDEDEGISKVFAADQKLFERYRKEESTRVQ